MGVPTTAIMREGQARTTDGALYVTPTGNAAITSGTIQLDSGSSGAPSYSFNAGTTSGMFYAGGNVVTVVSGGSPSAAFGNTSIVVGLWDGAATGFSITAASAGAGNADRAGENLFIGSGQGTGAGAVGYVGFKQAPSGSTGSSLNPYIVTQVSHNTKSVTNNSAATIASFALASNTVIAGSLKYAVEVFDGTNLQVEEGIISFHAINKGGVFSGNTVLKSGNQQAVTSGTLVVTWAISGANPAVLSVNANSSLTPSTGYPRVTYDLSNLTQQAVTIA